MDTEVNSPSGDVEEDKEEGIEIDLEIVSSRKTDDHPELTIVPSSTKKTKEGDDVSSDDKEQKNEDGDADIPTYPGLHVVEVQANEEMKTSVNLEDYTAQILSEHQQRVLEELSLPASSKSDNGRRGNKLSETNQTRSDITSIELTKYTEKLVGEHHADAYLEMKISCEEDDILSDDEQEAVKECLQNLVRSVSLNLDPKNTTPPTTTATTKKIPRNSRLGVPQNQYHDYRRRFICYWCDRRFPHFSALKAHISAHLESARKLCTICNKTFSKKSSLEEHIRTHTGERPYKCNQCGKTFVTSGKLTSHLKIHAGIYAHHCQLCGKKFREHYNLKMHMKMHERRAQEEKEPKKTKMWNCKECEAGFTRKEDLNSHKKEDHKTPHQLMLEERKLKRKAEEKEKAVNEDGVSAAKKRTLRTTGFTQKEDGTYVCDLCQKEFVKKDYLNRHLRRHESSTATDCGECGKTYRDKPTMRQHMVDAHGSEAKHYCNICKQGFVILSTLQRHMRIHLDSRPFTCDQCPGTYKSKEDLRRHKRTHEADRPYKCDICHNGFVDKSGLNRLCGFIP
ncbi:zinc finger protein ZFP2-like [Clytia hemisphaerica]|uniref:C2H2-type domain-containing protein n=1 Tax=Clytia hemisphaerica TaxID=252671 RepID=A0A7M5X463_9CNID